MKMIYIKEDGTIKGAWIATGVTVVTFGFFALAMFWEEAARNLERFGIYLVGAYSVSIGAYLLKKYKENAS